jgi:hypothetical protein
MLCSEWSLNETTLGKGLPEMAVPVIITLGSKDPFFLGPIEKAKILFPCSLHISYMSWNFQRESDFKTKGNQRENTP